MLQFGFTEGIENVKEKYLQDGFNAGFRTSSHAFFNEGFAQGALAYAALMPILCVLTAR